MKDFPKPNVENTKNYQESNELSSKFIQLKNNAIKKKVVIIGGGLSGLACGKYLSDCGMFLMIYLYLVKVYESSYQ